MEYTLKIIKDGNVINSVALGNGSPVTVAVEANVQLKIFDENGWLVAEPSVKSQGDDLWVFLNKQANPDLILTNYEQFNAVDTAIALEQFNSTFAITGTRQAVLAEEIATSGTSGKIALGILGAVGIGAAVAYKNDEDENEAPTDIQLNGTSVKTAVTLAENARGIDLGTLSSVDANSGDTHVYTVDDPRFEITNNVLGLKAGKFIDYESEPSILLTLTSTDNSGLIFSSTLTVQVTDLDDPAVIAGDLHADVTEDQTNSATGNLTVIDDDASDNPINFEASSQTGQYGDFELVTAANGSATWTYTVKNDVAQPLDEGDVFTESFIVEAKDVKGIITKQTIKVDVTGINDTPVANDETTPEHINFEWGNSNVSNQLINNLGGEKGYGENEVERLGDDLSTDKIDITSVFGSQGLNFYGTHYDGMFINANGNITFTKKLPKFTPDFIGDVDKVDFPIIAPFWADVDQNGQPNNADINRLWYDLDDSSKTVTITWDQVGYYKTHTDKLNTFQMQIKDMGNGDFDVLFRYQDIQWTVGDVSGDTHARAGWSSGDGKFYEIPSSGDESYMLNIEKFSNSGNPGVFEFNVRDGEVYESNNTIYSTIIDVLANDSDIDDSAELTLTDVVMVDGKGTVEITDDNKVKYIAATEALTAGDSQIVIEYTITDEFGATSSAKAFVDITSEFVNTAPLSKDFSVETSGTYAFSQDDFPFIDPDLFNSLKAVKITELPASGILALNGTDITADTIISATDLQHLVYTSVAGVTAPATFKFTVQDDGSNANGGNDTSDSHTATITFNDVSHSPQALDSKVEVIEDTQYSFTANDFGFSDKSDNDALKAVIVEEIPTNGTFSLAGNIVSSGDVIEAADITSLTYMPEDNWYGLSTLKFNVKDDGAPASTPGRGNTGDDLATLTFDVSSVNDGVPTLTGTDVELQYKANGGAKKLFSGMTATDLDIIDTNGYDGLKIMLARDTPNADDVFSSGNNNIIFTSNGDIELSGDDIGDITNVDGQLILEFNRGVGDYGINGTLNNLEYTNTNAQAGESFSLSWSVYDNDPAGSLFSTYEQSVIIL